MIIRKENNNKYNSEDLKLEENKGVIGILTKEGAFFRCQYGDHDKLIHSLKSKAKGAIIFGVSERGSYLLKDKETDILTIHQKRSLNSHIKYLDDMQKLIAIYMLKEKV